MGGVSSTPRGGPPEESAEYLIGVFVGSESCPMEADYWKKLLELPLSLHWPSHRVKQACELLMQNNYRTKHLAKILVHLGCCLHECVTGSGLLSSAITKALNALYISSVFLKYLIEYSKSDNFEELYLSIDEDMSNYFSKDQDIQHFLMYNVLNFVGNVDMSPNTFVLHYELLNFMLITISTQLRSEPSPGPSDFHPFTDAAMDQDSSLVGSVACKLLLNYITRPRYSVSSNTIFSKNSQPGVLQKVGSVAANFVLLPFNLFAGSNDEVSRSPLADISLHILLVLVHYRKCVIADYVKDKSGYSILDSVPKEDTCFSENPFCKALENARDIDFDRADIEGNANNGPVVKVSFAALFDTLGMYLSQEASVLLLYSLVQGNSNFLEYVLVRTDLDTLLVPLLETLYNASKRSSNHIYMVLIILLILSQDSSFNASIHKLMLPGVPWYQERRLHQTSLGSLMVIVLIRTVKYNLSKLRDVYLHTNCLATLANMAPHVHHLSAYASQRLVSLFDMLSRKYNKLAEMKNGKMHEASGESAEGDDIADDASAELHIYTDFLRIVLEIVNAILTYALPRNPEVVYAIMHRQEVFQPFKNHPRFNELVENIFTVLDFFNIRMDSQQKDGEWSVEKVLQLIITNCRSWRGEGIKMFTTLRFTYEQESHPEEFFIPYVWKLVMSSSGLSFDLGNINLFAVEMPVEVSTMDSYGEEVDKLGNDQKNAFEIEVETPV
ncbi:hypothetical protein Leryth_019459 [Lithospermum erythrorhizon]|nr:hypothetical protein Leryth_019459 [Lithospermum erythrorhizon]